MNCHYCGIEWRLAVPLKYHGEEDKPNRWHCFDDECVEKCDRCKSSAEENISNHIHPDVITLSEDENIHATKIGVLRQKEAERMRLKDKHGFTGEGENIHVEGARGEMAVAKRLGIKWEGHVNTFKRFPDVDGNIQVRTRSKDWYELIVRCDDPLDAKYVLVTGTTPKYRVRGWIKGKDAMKAEYLKTHGGREEAYFIPQFMLSPMEGLDRRSDSPV